MTLRFAIAISTVTLIIANAHPSVAQESGSQVPRTRSGFPMFQTPPAGQEDVYDGYQQGFGFVPNVAKIAAGSEALSRSVVDLQSNLSRHAVLSATEVNLVQMTIAVENQCEYCTAGHTMGGKMKLNTPDSILEGVRQRTILTDPKLNALRNFAIVVYAKRGEITPRDLQKFLDAGYRREHALDVIACIAAKVLTNYTNSLAKTPVDEGLLPLAKSLPFFEENAVPPVSQ